MSAKQPTNPVGEKPEPPPAPPAKAVCRCPCTCGHSHGKASGGTCAWCVASKKQAAQCTCGFARGVFEVAVLCDWCGANQGEAIKQNAAATTINGVPIPEHPTLEELRALIKEQAEDEGLWAVPIDPTEQHISEAYLQQELRKLHIVVEAFLASV